MSGTVLDIGCGDDLCVRHAVAFDQQHGDANHVQEHFQPETFDCVHSSHCLEHMQDPVDCLRQWWSLVKPGAFLVTVVPDEDFYEQGYWPSLFNPYHKHTFRLEGSSSWSPVSFCLPGLIAALPAAKVLSARRQLDGYNKCYTVGFRSVKTLSTMPCHVPAVKHKVFGLGREVLLRTGLIDTLIDRLFVRAAIAAGAPIDQTLGKALAQLEVIAQKGDQCR
jgi:SAM-dependent methyltransferase